MGLSIRTQHLKRYRDVAALMMKYGRGDLLRPPDAGEAAAEIVEGASGSATGQPTGGDLARDLEKLGPTFVKMGQILSSRSDMLPPPIVEALSRLQDDVAPFPWEQVEATVTEELGVRMSKAFASFDQQPIAAASLGQVHRATLRDGREVAVKVQRPDIRKKIVEDLEAFEELASVMDQHTENGRRIGYRGMVEEFRKSMISELDYRQEASNLDTLAANLAEFDRIVVPRPVHDYTSSRVLTIDFIHGEKVTCLSPVVRTELPGREMSRQLFQAYLKQILADGFVHADPHPGNVLVTPDGRVALLDLGMVIRIAPDVQEKLLRLLFAVSEGRADAAATAGIALGERSPDFDETAFRRMAAEIVMKNRDASIAQIQPGSVMLALARESGACGIRMIPELTLVGKALLNLEQVGTALDPTFEPNAAVKDYAAELTRQRVVRGVAPGNLLAVLLEMQGFVEKLPRRINHILDNVAGNRLKVQVDAIDEKLLVEGFQKVANRITMGLVLAALIVGAALLMRVETSFRIFGYPGLAILLFLVAAGSGMALLAEIFLADRRTERRARSAIRHPRAG